jgi:hypothetical protein
LTALGDPDSVSAVSEKVVIFFGIFEPVQVYGGGQVAGGRLDRLSPIILVKSGGHLDDVTGAGLCRRGADANLSQALREGRLVQLLDLEPLRRVGQLHVILPVVLDNFSYFSSTQTFDSAAHQGR